MTILDKLAFWKKKDEFDLGDFGAMPGEEKDKGMPSAEPSPFDKEMGTEPLGFPEEPGMHPSMAAGVPEEPSGPDFSAPPGGPATTMRHTAAQTPSPSTGSRDIELISAKLDTIRAILENINNRLEALERIAKSSEHEEYPRY